MLWIAEAMNGNRPLRRLYSLQVHSHICHCTAPITTREVVHGESTTKSWPLASLPLWRLPRSAAHARSWQFSHSDGSCPDQCYFWWPWQDRQWVMFCLTLRGDALEPDGCASSTHSGGEWVPGPCYAHLCGPTGWETHLSWSCNRGLAW